MAATDFSSKGGEVQGDVRELIEVSKRAGEIVSDTVSVNREQRELAVHDI